MCFSLADLLWLTGISSTRLTIISLFFQSVSYVVMYVYSCIPVTVIFSHFIFFYFACVYVLREGV